jgi:hypothetical protein
MGKNKMFFLISAPKEIRSRINITTKPVVEKVVKIASTVSQNIKPLFFLTKDMINNNRLRNICRTPGSQNIP